MREVGCAGFSARIHTWLDEALREHHALIPCFGQGRERERRERAHGEGVATEKGREARREREGERGRERAGERDGGKEGGGGREREA